MCQTKILFVCLGNICRSPLAEGIFKSKAESNAILSGCFLDSAGTSGWHQGELPDHRAIAVAHNNSITLTHRARKLNSRDFHDFDYILAMDQNNLIDIKKIMPPNARAEVALLGGFDIENPNIEVPDPYYGNMESFEETFAIINNACDGLIEHLIKHRTSK